jgi:hypothetical protein
MASRLRLRNLMRSAMRSCSCSRVALEYVANHAGVWLTASDEIAEGYVSQRRS